MELKDGKRCRFLVSVLDGGKVIGGVWCSSMAEAELARREIGERFETEVHDMTWADGISGYSAYMEAKNAAISSGCSYFCTDILFASHGITEMSRHTGDTFYEIRRSINKGLKSKNGHTYELLTDNIQKRRRRGGRQED